jgi:hypothetical protein
VSSDLPNGAPHSGRLPLTRTEEVRERFVPQSSHVD